MRTLFEQKPGFSPSSSASPSEPPSLLPTLSPSPDTDNVNVPEDKKPTKNDTNASTPEPAQDGVGGEKDS